MSKVEAFLENVSPEKRQLFLRKLQQKLATQTQEAPPARIPPRDPSTPPQLSFAQQRLWFLDRFAGSSAAYNLPAVLRFDGRLDLAVLHRSLAQLVLRHEALRTTIREQDGVPLLEVQAPRVHLPIVDLQALDPVTRQNELEQQIRAAVLTPFALAGGALLRWRLLRTAAEQHVLVFNLHHIVCDGWSISLLIRDLTALYRAELAGTLAPLPPLAVQYTDFAVWQREQQDSAAWAQQLAYWVAQLADLPPQLELPNDRSRTLLQNFHGKLYRQSVAAPLVQRHEALGRALGATPFMTLLAVFQLLLARLSQNRDFAVGVPVAGRQRAELENLVGMFLNTLVFRCRLGDDEEAPALTFRQLVAQVREAAVAAYANQDVPIEKVIEKLDVERTVGLSGQFQNPLFQVLFNMLNLPPAELDLPGVKVEPLELPDQPAKFDLTVYAQLSAEGLTLLWAYNAEIFSDTRIAEMARQYELLLTQVTADAERPLEHYSLVTEVARAVLPDPLTRLDDHFPGAVHDLFFAHAQRAPERVAVVDPVGVSTYGQLTADVLRLAAALLSLGVEREAAVVIYAHRSAALVPAVLATLAAGGTFVLLDPQYPPPRLAAMARQVQPRVVLALSLAGELPDELALVVAELGGTRLQLLPDATLSPALPREESAPLPRPQVGPDDRAVIAFTSGSTGVPRGVEGRHGPLTHFLPWQQAYFALGPEDRYTLLSGLSHDPLQRDVFTPLTTGATVVIPDPEQRLEPGYLARFMVEERASIAHLTPAMVQLLVDTAAPGTVLPSLRRAFVVGEMFSARDADRLRELAPHVAVVNFFGSTETQRAVGFFAYTGRASLAGREVLPLGHGMPDVQLLVVKPGGGLAGIGEVGEIRVRSPHLARGYLGEPALTAARFVDGMYLTGDLGRYRLDGVVEPLGRMDHQVKIRGFRVEPGEVEAALRQHPGVRECVVVADRGDGTAGMRLVAYVVGGTPPAVLREHLRQRLPDYMVPALFVELEALPRLPNSKVDRRRLPAPTAAFGEAERPFEAPRSPTEQVIAEIWQQVLGVARVGIDDSFFELGGHSLLATQAVSRIHAALGVELPLRRFFTTPTVRGLAIAVFELAAAADPGQRWKSAREQTIERRPPERRPQARPQLSFAQHRLWFLHQLAPKSAFYNMPGAFHFRGQLEVLTLERTFNEIVRRHEILRTRFVVTDGEPRQVIAPHLSLALPLIDLQALAAPAQAARRLGEQFLRQSFDLEQLPLLALQLVRLGGADPGPAEHVLFLVIHHIISDGWSQRVLHHEVAEIYAALGKGQPSPLAELAIQYSDFAVWQRSWLSEEVLARQLDYWKNLIAGAPELLELPTDRPRPPVQTLAGSHLPVVLPSELTAAARALSEKRGLSLYMTLFAVFQVVLSRWSGQTDLLVGSPIANRNKGELEGLIGFFVNMLLRRTDVSGNPTFSTLLERVQDATLAAYDHQDLPFERLVSELKPERNLAYTPLFQVMFNLLNFPHAAPTLAHLEIQTWELDTATSKYDLSLYFAGSGRGPLRGFFEYSSDLFDRTTVARWREQYQNVLQRALAAPQTRIHDLPLLAPAEHHALLIEANAVPKALVNDGEGIHHLILTRARQAPDAVALAAGDAALSLGALVQRAAQIARLLQDQGVGPDVLVGVALQRSVDLVAALLGVLQAGGAYVPLDPTYPAARLTLMLEDARPRVLLTEAPAPAVLSREGGPWATIDLGAALPPSSGRERALGMGPILPGQLAYVIYTSGSTGKPKGVAVGHRSVVAFLRAMAERPGLTAEEIFLAVTTLSFDIAGLELYLPLIVGARLELARDPETADSGMLAARLAAVRATTLQATPATFNLLLATDALPAGGLRRILCGGEALTRVLADRLLATGAQVWNVYGPTETTIWSAVEAVLPDGAAGSIALGIPIAGTCFYLLDRRGALSPLGIAGELMIAGAGLARGYLARPGLTAERFLPDPFAESLAGPPGARCYRTGDLVRYRPQGSLEFLGRIDHQVKVRGFRIELGEIEAALVHYPGVRAAVVGVRRRPASGDQLVAWLELQATEETPAPALATLHEFVAQRLPDYMVPAAFVLLEEFPRTPAGKVARQALPDPESSRLGLADDYQAPANPLESFLVELWQEVLGMARVGVEDRFFHLGGNSIQAAIFTNRLQQALGEIVHVTAVFRYPTIRELSAFLSRDYALALARLGTAGAPATSRVARAPGIDAEQIVELRQLAAASIRAQRRWPGKPATRQQQSPIFILSPPRAGSTLLRVMLAGHPQLFAPPELELLSFATVGERRAAFTGVHGFAAEGLVRAVMELRDCTAATAKAWLDRWADEDLPVAQVYALLQDGCNGRRLVDKTTTYALDLPTLHRAEELFAGAHYIHLLRHPCATLKSYVDVRLDQFLRFDNPFTGRQQAELLWVIDQQNIREFLRTVPAARQFQLRFEDLLSDPEGQSRELCAFLGLEFAPAMLEPYSGRRMTDGIYRESRMHGDPRFHEHQGIDPAVAEKWRGNYRWQDLAPLTQQLAVSFGYAREQEPVPPAAGLPAAELPAAAPSPPRLSFAQQRLWFLDRLEPDRATYNIPLVVRFAGRLAKGALTRALAELVRRHEVLRTTFTERDGVAVQVIHPAMDRDLPLVDLRALAPTTRQGLAQQLAREEAARPFDLTRGPVLRSHLVQTDDAEHWLLVTQHHIASDGWSLGVMLREVALLYGAFVTEPRLRVPSPLPELALQYADFARWQRQWLAGPELANQLAWWREQLTATPALELPTDHPRPLVASQRGASLRVTWPAALTSELNALSRRANTTLFVTLLASFAVLLQKLSGQHDFAIGTPVAGRHRAELEPMIGFFVNPLVVRTRTLLPPAEDGFVGLLERVAQHLLAVYAHQDVPFEQLVDALELSRDTPARGTPARGTPARGTPARDLSRTPLFQVLFALQNAPVGEFELPELRLSSQPQRTGTAKFDLELMFTEVGGELSGRLEYARDLFDATTMARLLRNYASLVTTLLAAPERPLAEVEMLSSAERQQILAEWNDTQQDLPWPRTLAARIAQQVASTPDALAVNLAANWLSFDGLNSRSEQLAHRLQQLGVGPEVPVGILLERSVELMVGLLAVLKAGGWYVPLDPSYPENRLAFMLTDLSGIEGFPVLLIGAEQEALAERLCPQPERRLCLTGHGAVRGSTALAPTLAAPRRVRLEPEHLAYTIYTSGSTGQPKGAMNSHQGICNRLQWMQDAYSLSAADTVLQKTPISFDVSVWELFWPLLCGARLVLAEPEGHKDSLYLQRLIAGERVTLLHFVPAMLDAFIDSPAVAPLHSLRQVIASGEALSQDLVDRLARRVSAPLDNLYGPTEAAVDVTFERSTPGSSRRTVPIGRPISNLGVWVLDQRMRPVAIGVAGELHLGGMGLARGYLKRPGLTADRFVPHPLTAEPGARLYTTGDLGRLQPAGAIEYLGRTDHQVKIRGFRIELGEIEAMLLQHPWVQECVVVAQPSAAEPRLAAPRMAGPGLAAPRMAAPRLVAYVVGAVIADTLRDHLLRRLPEYMVPAVYVELENLPRLPNGKLDRHQLPAVDSGAIETERPFIAPRNPTEQTIAEIWREVLGAPRISIDDSFFELGGHSLLATQAVSRIHAALQVELPLRRFFAEPTVRDMAVAVLELAAQADPEMSWKSAREQVIHRRPPAVVLPLSFAQHRLWFVHQLAPDSPFYNMARAFHFRGPLQPEILGRTFNEIVSRHEILRTCFVAQGGEPVQVIAPHLPIAMSLVDLQALRAPAQVARKLGERFLRRPFHLDQLPLLALKLVRLGHEEHVLFLVIHHIVFDGWSEMVLQNEVAQIYDALAAGRPSPLPELAIQYGDFALWQRGWLSEQVLAGQLAYWQNLAAGAPELLELPTDRPRPAVQTLVGDHLFFVLPETLTAEIRRHCEQRGLSLYMLLFAVFQVLLHRFSGQSDLVVGSPIANRNKVELEGMLGFFVNMLLRRTDLSGNPTFATLLERVRTATLESYDHQDLPFERLVAELRPERNLAYTPLFQVMFNLLNFPRGTHRPQALEIKAWDVDTATSKYDLSLYFFGSGDGPMLSFFEYSSDLFDRATVARLRDHYNNLLRAALAASNTPIQALALIGPAERHALLVEHNAVGTALVAAGEGIHHLVGLRAAQSPDAVALAAGETALSGRALIRRADQIAARLRGLGVGPEVLVGVSLSRSVDLVAALLGVLQAGGAYVPLDPSYPAARLTLMLEDARPRVLLTEPSTPIPLVDAGEGQPWQTMELGPASRGPALRGPASRGPALRGPASRGPASPAAQAPEKGLETEPIWPGQLAYVIYTSGSTGRPKGVAVGHRSVVAFLRAMARRPGLTADEVFVAVTTLSFDIAGLELYLPLSVGARLELLHDAETADGGRLAARLATVRASAMQATPATWNLLLATGSLSPGLLRRILCGGEALTRTLAEALLATGAAVWNVYGPTETTIWSAVERVLLQSGDHSSVALGTPIAGTCFYLLDRHGVPVPLGVAGELLIGGAGLARGYLARPALTAARFIPDPFAPQLQAEPGARCYRTGDLTRYRAFGSLEFLGRIDTQVKVRGFRIELGEIEAALVRHPDVQAAVVGVRRRPPSGDQLVAWLEPRAKSGGPSVEELRDFVAQRLPDYMVPSAFLLLTALPRTPAGKLDRQSLPDPTGSRPGLTTDYQAPETALEKFLADGWREVLGIAQVGVNDRFFHLGGNSIQAAIFTNRLQEALGEVVHVTAIFRHQTIRELIAFLERDYAAALPRLGLPGRETAAGSKTREPGITAPQLVLMRELAAQSHALSRAQRSPLGSAKTRQEPSPIFVLSPPRAGSTLLRVMLAGHPQLFAPPELELLSFATLGERRDAFQGAHSFATEGLVRAVMELRDCDAAAAKALIARYEDEDLEVSAFYAQLQAWCGNRRLVDKTTTYALDPQALSRAEEWFSNARYIHLLRHPCATLKSYVDVRLDQFLRFDNPFSGRQQAELLWVIDHQNILEFLQSVPPERQFRLRFEDLLSDPEAQSRELCAWLGLDFVPAMLEPYSGARMTDGIYQESRMHGDPRFHEHQGIEVAVAEKWRGTYRWFDLAADTQKLAIELGYPSEDNLASGLEIPRREDPTRAPLSWMQEAFWLIEQQERSELSVYRSNHQALLQGQLNVSALAQSFAIMVDRHEILRTRFDVNADGETFQEVLPQLEVLLPQVDLTALAPPRRAFEEQRVLLQRSRRRLDLRQAPAWLLLLVRLESLKWSLLVSMHHIINDHWSMSGVFFPELARCYEALARGQAPQLPQLSLQYGDYAQWERHRLQDQVLTRLLGYWGDKLAGGIPQLHLRTDRPRPSRPGFRGDSLGFALSPELTRALEQRSREAGVSLYMLSLAAYQLLLAQHSGQHNILVASPTANRFRKQTEQLFGCFANMLLLHTDLAGNPTLEEVLARVGETVLGAFSHQELPFMLALANFPPPDFAFDRSPFQAMFTFLNAPREAAGETGPPADSIAGIAASLRTVNRGTTDQDLALWLVHGERIQGTLIYDNELFDRPTAEAMVADYERLLAALTERPEARLAEVLN